MNADDLVALNEEIAGMARAGLPLDQGLRALAKEMGRGRLQKVTAAIAADLEAGKTLPEALQHQGKTLPPYYASLVAVGIRTGRMGEVLVTLTTYARNLHSLRSIVREALVYPTLVLVCACLLLMAFGWMIVPQFEAAYKGFDLILPISTQITLFLCRYPVILLFGPILLIVLAVGAARLACGFRPQGRRRWARIFYGFPLVGTMVRASRQAAFAELLAILVDQEVPLAEAFQLAGQATADPVMAGSAEEIHKQLVEGRPLGQVLSGRGLVPAWVSWLIGHGERQAALGKSLHHVASFYQRQVTLRAAYLRNVLPPFLIICTAGLILATIFVVVVIPFGRMMEALTK